MDQDTWNRGWSYDFGAGDVTGSQDQNGGAVAPQSCAGFFELWGYAARLKEFFASLEGRSSVNLSDLFKLRDRAREIQSWMLNLRSRQISSRFDAVRQKVNEGIDSDVTHHEADPGGGQVGTGIHGQRF